MLFIGDLQKVPIPPARFERHNKLVEHHFAKRVWCAQPPRNRTHWHIAIPRERSLNDGKIKSERPNRKLRKLAVHAIDSVPLGSAESIASPRAAAISLNTAGSTSMNRRRRSASAAALSRC